MLSRRNILLVGGGAAVAAAVGGVALVEARIVPGRIRLHTALGLTGPDGTVPDIAPGPRVGGQFVSRAQRGRSVTWAASYPPGAAANASLPVVVFLHGRHGDHRQGFDQLGLDRYLAAAVDDGVRPFVVATVDGGPDAFWHRRRGGDPEAMLWDELLPVLRSRGLRTDRIGLYGFSMGGYGALLHASRRQDQVAAVATAAPALWRSYTEAAAGAFDDAGDFRANDVYARRDELRGVPLRIDCGNDDPFAPNVEHFVAGLPRRPAGGFQPGAHTAGYVRRMAPEALRFLAERLTD